MPFTDLYRHSRQIPYNRLRRLKTNRYPLLTTSTLPQRGNVESIDAMQKKTYTVKVRVTPEQLRAFGTIAKLTAYLQRDVSKRVNKAIKASV
jgi:hypothetical protein